jgi:hypothetical protein
MHYAQTAIADTTLQETAEKPSATSLIQWKVNSMLPEGAAHRCMQ